MNIYKQKIHTVKATSINDVLVNGAAVVKENTRKGTNHCARVYPFTVIRQSLKIPISMEGKSNASVRENKTVEI